MTSLVGDVAVAIVFLEKANSLVAFIQANRYLALLSILARGKVRTQQSYLILCVGFAHTAWFRLHPGEGSQGQSRLGLAETFHQTYARQLEELVVHSSIQCLASRRTVAKSRKIIVAEVLSNKETIDRRRCTEACYMVLLHLTKYLLCRELFVVEDKDAGPRKPLSVELSPDSLAPPCIGNSKMNAVGREVMPEDTSREVPKSVEEVVRHHFGLARSA